MDRLKISKIRRDGGTQARALIRQDIVDEYAAPLADPNYDLREVIVFCDAANYWLADGFQRCAAYEQAGRTEIPVRVKNGTLKQAILYAAGANGPEEHGVQRTPEDKRKAIELLLADPEWAAKSDRSIAEACKLDHKTVAAVRKSVGEFPNCPKTGRDGKAYKPRKPKTPDREPGDDTPPKVESGAETFQTKVFHQHLGHALKELFKLAHQYGLLNARGQPSSKELLGLDRRLKEWMADADGWQEKLKKEAKKTKKGA